MKKILVPTDFSEQSGFAFDLACQMAETNHAIITVLHVLDYTGVYDFTAGASAYPMMGSPAGLEFDEKFLNTLHSAAEEKMEEFVETHKKKGIQITSEIKIGNAYLYITDKIREEEIDLVLMGSKGTGNTSEMLIGSNTEKVVRHAKCPVLTVKQAKDLKSIHNIVFASTFTPAESSVSNDLLKLQAVFNAKLHLVRINTPNNFETTRKAKRLIQEFIDKNAIKNYTINIYNDKLEEDGIIYFAQDIDADLIALATHGRSGILHLLSGSIAEDVVNHAKRPVWTFRIK